MGRRCHEIHDAGQCEHGTVGGGQKEGRYQNDTRDRAELGALHQPGTQPFLLETFILNDLGRVGHGMLLPLDAAGPWRGDVRHGPTRVQLFASVT